MPDSQTGSMTRRSFLGTGAVALGAGAAALGSAGCRERRTAVPYTRRPPETVPGVAMHYATTCPGGARSWAVLVKTREGRPIHVAGNDEHPGLRGATCPQAMAGIQGLYGPGRLDAPTLRGRRVSWAEAAAALREALAPAAAGGRALLLAGATTSPTRLRLLEDLGRALPGLDILAWAPGEGMGAQAGALAAYGSPLRIRPRLDRARCLLCLGADPLDGSDPALSRAFAASRRDPGDMARLWALEGPLSLTGANADHRLALRPSRLAAVAFSLARHLRRRGLPLPPGAPLPEGPEPPELPVELRDALVDDLWKTGRNAAVLAGPAMPPEVHVAAHLLNAMLGSQVAGLEPAQRLATPEDLGAAQERVRAGSYQALLAWGANPAYASPDPDGWRAALAAMPASAWMGAEADETGSACALRLPEHHWLEAWGDHRDGDLLTLQQPAVAPLYDTRQGEDLLNEVLRGLGHAVPEDHLARLQARWREEVLPLAGPVPFPRFFQAALHDGVLEAPQAPVRPSLRGDAVREAAAAAERSAEGPFELVLRPAHGVGDGTLASSGWLQELPDPIHKGVWGSPLSLAPADAARAGLREGDQAWVQAGNGRGLFSVHLQPGQAEGVLAADLGYGRKSGPARGVGVSAYPLLGAGGSARLTRGRGHQDLASTRGRDPLPGEAPARTLPLAELPALVREDAHHPTLYPEGPPEGPRWGMAIDLTACLGCPTCVVACQSENNVPVVGPAQVAKGREMHWLRVDAYGLPGEAVFQPMLCQHCEAAPCETVCPVNATNHSPDGLNQMVYNRCVGVRYCANNCPYKVRRFNFLEYNGAKAEPEILAFNPDVTVRPRGVMEKCTFCVQRIQDARMRAQGEGRTLRDGDVVPACAAACPTEAIVFGDLADPSSRVSRLAADRRGYHVLDALGARPVITYLARVRNPHPRVAP